jgi:hypothetical protein
MEVLNMAYDMTSDRRSFNQDSNLAMSLNSSFDKQGQREAQEEDIS